MRITLQSVLRLFDMKTKIFYPELYYKFTIAQDAVNNIDGSSGILHNQRRASNIVKNTTKLETPTPPESASQFRVPQHQSVILSYSKQGKSPSPDDDIDLSVTPIAW